MLYNVKVYPKSSRKLVKKDNCGFRVYLTKPACDGLANSQLIELLSEALKVKKYNVNIIKGEKSRVKLVEITE